SGKPTGNCRRRLFASRRANIAGTTFCSGCSNGNTLARAMVEPLFRHIQQPLTSSIDSRLRCSWQRDRDARAHGAISKSGKSFFSLHLGAPRYKRFVMEKITLLFAELAAIIAMTILQACAGTAATAGTQCATPTLTPSDATRATTSITVRIATKTAGAFLRYTLDGSTPTGGLSGNGTQIAAASGKVWFTVGSREKTLKAIAYKPGLADSLIAEGTYVYESPY